MRTRPQELMKGAAAALRRKAGELRKEAAGPQVPARWRRDWIEQAADCERNATELDELVARS